MRTALVVLLLAAMAAVVVVSHCSSDEGGERDSAPSAAAEPIESAPRPGAVKSLDQLFIDAMAVKGYTLDGPEPPVAAMRDALATALTVWMPGATFDAKKTTLTVRVTDGSGCDTNVLEGLAVIGADVFRRVGFTRIKCEPEGHTVPLR